MQLSADPELGYVRVWVDGAADPITLSPEGAMDIGTALTAAGRLLMPPA